MDLRLYLAIRIILYRPVLKICEYEIETSKCTQENLLQIRDSQHSQTYPQCSWSLLRKSGCIGSTFVIAECGAATKGNPLAGSRGDSCYHDVGVIMCAVTTSEFNKVQSMYRWCADTTSEFNKVQIKACILGECLKTEMPLSCSV